MYHATDGDQSTGLRSERGSKVKLRVSKAGEPGKRPLHRIVELQRPPCSLWLQDCASNQWAVKTPVYFIKAKQIPWPRAKPRLWKARPGGKNDMLIQNLRERRSIPLLLDFKAPFLPFLSRVLFPNAQEGLLAIFMHP